MTDLKARPDTGILALGGLSALLVALGSVADILIGTLVGGDLTALPQTAAAQFQRLHDAPYLGLYGLDLLNLVTTLIMLPAFYGAYVLLRSEASRLAGLGLALSVLATAVFVANNPALPMLGLAGHYTSSADEGRRQALAAAGEAILAKGRHGSPGVLPGFLLSMVANLVLSGAMLGKRAFPRATPWLGLVGNGLLAAYLVLVTFSPEVKTMATLFAAPGGLMCIAWLVLFAQGLFAASRRSRAQ